jgi:hypothetical protein
MPLTRLLPVLLPLWLPALLLHPGATRAEDLRHDCLAWQHAHGAEQVALADRIGSAQLLTRAHQPAEVGNSGSRSLYSWSDIQRLCRRQ